MAFLKCLQCGQILESRSVHDFVRCSCENQTFLDGGGEYFRYGGKDMSKIQIIEYDTMSSRIRRSGLDDDPENDEKSYDELIRKLDKTLEDYC